jgi:hypothetical protein
MKTITNQADVNKAKIRQHELAHLLTQRTLKIKQLKVNQTENKKANKPMHLMPWGEEALGL